MHRNLNSSYIYPLYGSYAANWLRVDGRVISDEAQRSQFLFYQCHILVAFNALNMAVSNLQVPRPIKSA